MRTWNEAVFPYIGEVTPLPTWTSKIFQWVIPLKKKGCYNNKISKLKWTITAMGLCVHLFISFHKTPPGKHCPHSFYIRRYEFLKLHETTEAMGIMTSLFHYFTQPSPLENGDHTVGTVYKQQNSIFARNHF